ncbi:MAG: RNA methyltransferase [Bacteroidales bacterium]|nr:RNA methyltransferase [Bacteroidales bacterium]
MGKIKQYVAKTLFGLENVLASELETLGASDVKPANRAVLFTGNTELLYKVNYCVRTALSILLPVNDFNISSKEDLYLKASAINWSEFMDNDTTFSVVPVVNSKIFQHTSYPGLIVKDAIADFFRKKTGRRPYVDTHDPDLVINLHISNQRVNISLDSTVIPLYKRGYRAEHGKAPLNEVLAAGILMLSGWDGSLSLHDPMCGSGTLPVEAALLAKNIPPGKFRQFFGFTKWKDFDEKLFTRVKEKSEKKISNLQVRISASDISREAVRQSFANFKRAGLEDVISLKVADFKDVTPQEDKGYLVFNPPYGQRLNKIETDTLYPMIGSVLKHNFPGFKAWILTSGKENLNKMGLKPGIKHTLFNGSLECILAGFEMYEGSRKKSDNRKSNEKDA